MIENIPQVEAALGIPAGTLLTDIASADKKTIDLTGLEIMKKSDYATRLANEKAAAAKEHFEIKMKEVKTKHALAIDDNDADKIFDAFKTKVIAEANLPTDKKVADLTSDFNAMKKNFETEKQAHDAFKIETVKQANRRRLNETILGKMPDGVLPKDKLLTLFHTDFEAELTDAGIVYKKDGQVLKNKTTLSPQTTEEVIKDWFTPYAKPVTGGAGGGDSTHAAAGSIEEFTKQQEDKGVKPGTEAFNRALQLHMKAAKK